MSDETAEWTDWIEHDDGGFPVAVGVEVHRVFDREFSILDGKAVSPRSELCGPLVASEIYSWNGTRQWRGYKIPLVIRYRIRRPRALRDLITLVETLPAPERIPEGVQ
ncbi:hypothetical protein KZZ08_00610 [Roseovarius mucosus]|uniref:hypothetical protein n=1 Tax=Roseovarius mucosus TaxID=215743 RepID=UPI001C5CD0A9|nr:hypothetical protein [Roseovarius mucosus]MBW4972097.1 hypothetical protein [Roseovarius mucosus]